MAFPLRHRLHVGGRKQNDLRPVQTDASWPVTSFVRQPALVHYIILTSVENHL